MPRLGRLYRIRHGALRLPPAPCPLHVDERVAFGPILAVFERQAEFTPNTIRLRTRALADLAGSGNAIQTLNHCQDVHACQDVWPPLMMPASRNLDEALSWGEHLSEVVCMRRAIGTPELKHICTLALWTRVPAWIRFFSHMQLCQAHHAVLSSMWQSWVDLA